MEELLKTSEGGHLCLDTTLDTTATVWGISTLSFKATFTLRQLCLKLKTRSQNLAQMLASNKLHSKGDIFITWIVKL